MKTRVLSLLALALFACSPYRSGKTGRLQFGISSCGGTVEPSRPMLVGTVEQVEVLNVTTDVRTTTSDDAVLRVVSTRPAASAGVTSPDEDDKVFVSVEARATGNAEMQLLEASNDQLVDAIVLEVDTASQIAFVDSSRRTVSRARQDGPLELVFRVRNAAGENLVASSGWTAEISDPAVLERSQPETAGPPDEPRVAFDLLAEGASTVTLRAQEASASVEVQVQP